MDLDEIRQDHSVGGLILGWTESHVIGALGDDYSREVDEYGDLSIDYETRGILCTFWETNELTVSVFEWRHNAHVSKSQCNFHYCYEFVLTVFRKLRDGSARVSACWAERRPSNEGIRVSLGTMRMTENCACMRIYAVLIGSLD